MSRISGVFARAWCLGTCLALSSCMAKDAATSGSHTKEMASAAHETYEVEVEEKEEARHKELVEITVPKTKSKRARPETAKPKETEPKETEPKPAKLDANQVAIGNTFATLEAVELPESEPPAPAPAPLLPRTGYFENTYIGGNAAYQERLRRLDRAFSGKRRVWAEAAMSVAELDPPLSAGLAVSAALSARSLQAPGRVFLQIALRGSDRGGWVRPPLDVAIVLGDGITGAHVETARAMTRKLLQSLSGRDRVAIVAAEANAPRLLTKPGSVPNRRMDIVEALQGWKGGGSGAEAALAGAMSHAGSVLKKLAGAAHRVPGTQLVLAIVAPNCAQSVHSAKAAAHALTTQGAVTSLVAVGPVPETARWWEVANAGHGNFHVVTEADQCASVVASELSAISRVVARLVRINIRLHKNAHGVRIIGSRILGQPEARRVKAREVAVDANLSASLGLRTDRGEDDDGLQTVIPYFYGGDRHAILVELFVTKPGGVADVQVRYKDMLNLSNASASTSVALGTLARPPAPEQEMVLASVQSAQLGDVLGTAQTQLKAGQLDAAAATLRRAARQNIGGAEADRQLLDGVGAFLMDNRAADPGSAKMLQEVLGVAQQRQYGYVR